MNTPSLKDRLGDEESSADDEMTDAIVDAISANDKVIEIRPAKQSKRTGLNGLLLLGAGVIGLAYLVQRSETSDDLVEGTKEKMADRVNEAAESIDEGSEAASERIEAGTERASETAQAVGETASERAEEAGEAASEHAEKAGEAAADQTEATGEEVVERMVESDDPTPDEAESASNSSGA